MKQCGLDLLAQVRGTVTRKNGDILLVQNSPGARLPACAIFFGCEIPLHQSLAPRLTHCFKDGL